MDFSASRATGARLLDEVKEASLEEILKALRTSVTTIRLAANNAKTTAAPSAAFKLPVYPHEGLNTLIQRHFRVTQSPSLAISGRYLQLLYALIGSLITAPHNKAVVVIDAEGRFNVASLLDCRPFPDSLATKRESDSKSADDRPDPPPRVQPADLQHVYVYKPARGSRAYLQDLIASAADFMVYGSHNSRAREWWGTVIIGGGLLNNNKSSTASTGLGTTNVLTSGMVHVTAGWKGWLRVDREVVRGFGVGISLEEALAERDRRKDAVDAAGWVARSDWGGFMFGNEGGDGR